MYICEDRNNIGKDVHEVFVTMLIRYVNWDGGDKEKEMAAQNYLDELKTDKILLLDVWS